MKRFIFLVVILIFALVGCGEKKASMKQETGNMTSAVTANDEQKDGEPENTSTEKLVTNNESNGIAITITGAEIVPIKGDRTKDNVAQDNGEYFALGSEIVKASDYEQIEISVKFENKTDKAIFLSSGGWKITLPDGFELKNIMTTEKLNSQMPSNYTVEGKIMVVKEKALKVSKLNVRYNLMDYNEEWKQAFWEVVSGQLDAQKYMEKFKPVPMDFQIEID